MKCRLCGEMIWPEDFPHTHLNEFGELEIWTSQSDGWREPEGLIQELEEGENGKE